MLRRTITRAAPPLLCLLLLACNVAQRDARCDSDAQWQAEHGESCGPYLPRLARG